MKRIAFVAAALAAVPALLSAYTPLTDMGSQTYLGFPGGLYPGSTNQPPAAHAAAGASRAAQVVPLDGNGSPSASGKIVVVSVGMSNTTQEFCAAANPSPCTSWSFMGQAAADPNVNHTTLVIVNGAAGGQSAATWDSSTDTNYARVRDNDLAPAGVTERQVQAAWVKVANPGPTVSLPAANSDAYTLETQMGNIVRAMKTRWPNLKLVYFSSRIYGGYATTTLNPEPYAYESGFAVKWLVQAQIDQVANGGTIVDARAGNLDHNTGAPWIGWGPYLWADGVNPRSDGLTWVRSDFESDGTHPAMTAEQKVGLMLLAFFKTEPTTRPWFVTETPRSYFTVTPCRLVDTRDPTGPYGGPALAAGSARTFTIGGRCGVPAAAKAVLVNVTVTQPGAAGFLRLYGGGTAAPLVSTINYSAGQTRANNAVAPLGAGTTLTVRCDQASGAVQLILDVAGWFE